MNDLANRELIELERGHTGFPRFHRAVALTLGVVVVSLYVVWSVFEKDSDDLNVAAVERDQDVERMTLAPRPEKTADTMVEDAKPEDVARAQAIASSESDTPNDDAASRVAPSAEIREPAWPIAGDFGPISDSERPVSPSGVETSAADPQIAVPVVESVGSTRALEAAAAPARAATPHGANDTAWILAQEPSHYTLQLLGTSSMTNLKAFIDKQRDPERFGVYESTVKGKPFYVVLYGAYPDRDAAADASTRLAASVGRVNPWIRRFDSVQKGLPGSN